MELALLLITHLSVMGISFALGRIKGRADAEPKRDAKGRFAKRS